MRKTNREIAHEITDVADIKRLRESVELEMKSGQGRDGAGQIPKSFWETYSAFANTDGGIVILGVTEKDDAFTITGIKKTAKLRKELFDLLNDRTKVSHNLLTDADVIERSLNGATIMIIVVPRAPRKFRPVYVNNNLFEGTYRRNDTGDYHCTEQTVRRMVADAEHDTLDDMILPGFSIDNDIDEATVRAYRNLMSSTTPDHPWLLLDMREYLTELGAWRRDRQTGEEGLTKAGILMFGKHRAIHDAFPNYIVDYRQLPDDRNSSERWIDRITTDGTWTGNLFGFYRKVYPKLTSELKVPFRLVHSGQRIDETHVHEALREALVNTLIHADYSGTRPILIIKHHRFFYFRNCGSLRVSPEEIYNMGTVSDCRNRTLQKLFFFIGGGEQAGSGFSKILRAWHEQQWFEPILQETEFDVELRLSYLSFFSEESHASLDHKFGNAWRALSEEKRLILCIVANEETTTNSNIRRYLALHSHDVTLHLAELVRDGFLTQEGNRRSAHYALGPNSTTLEPNSTTLEPNSTTLEPNSTTLEPNSTTLAAESDETMNESTLALLRKIAAPAQNKRKLSGLELKRIICDLCSISELSINEISQIVDRRTNYLRKFLSELVEENRITMKYPNTPNHPHQRYFAVIDEVVAGVMSLFPH